MRLLTLAAGLMLTAALPAQFPFGHATPVNGYAASLFAQPIWIGNPGYGYAIEGAPPGGTALVAVSAGRQDQVVNGLDVYLDLANVVITHQGPIDATGRATLPFPLASPDEPALAGLELYAQAAVTDPAAPGSLGTTEALRIEITLHPLLAVSLFPHVWLVDPVAVTATPLAGIPAGLGVKDLIFANGGRDLFISTVDGLYVADTLAPLPQAVFMPMTAGNWIKVAWDRAHRRLYAVDNSSIAVFDGDRSSPAFGSLLLQVPAAYHSVDVSTDGSVIVFGVGNLVTRSDGDPTSPGYLQQILLPPVAQVTSNPPASVHVSPDGRVVSHLVTSQWSVPPIAINRFDTATWSWIDHDPATPGIQPISTALYPSLPTSALVFPSRDGSALIFAFSNVVGKIELDLNSPSNVTVTTTQVPSGFGTLNCSITPSASFLLRCSSTANPTMTNFSFVQVATGFGNPWVSLPEGGTSPVIAPVVGWR